METSYALFLGLMIFILLGFTRSLHDPYRAHAKRQSQPGGFHTNNGEDASGIDSGADGVGSDGGAGGDGGGGGD